MQNMLAVYTSKPPLSGRKLAELATQDGLQLRYLALDASIPSLDMQDTALSSVYGGARIVVGASDSDSDSITQFDRLIELGDRKPIAEMLTVGRLPCCELYAQRFDYAKWIARMPKDQPKIDGSVAQLDLPAVKSAKTRYVVVNESRRQSGRELMKRLTTLLAHATAGVVSEHQQPSR